MFPCAILLLLYYWFFYADLTSAVPKPPGVPPPPPSPAPSLSFLSDRPHHFKFVTENGVIAWQHDLPARYVFRQDRIALRDACHSVPDGEAVIAKGLALYEFMQQRPDPTVFSLAHAPRPLYEGDVFFFRCVGGRIHALEMCASGSTFVAPRCRVVNPCVGHPDGFKLPHSDVRRYVECVAEQEVERTCPPDTVFYFGACTDSDDIANFCRYNKGTRLLNATTKIECRHEEPVYVHCPPGTRFFDQPICESAECDGLPDNAKRALPEEKRGPFLFSPGYARCDRNRVAETVECPQTWDEDRTRGDDLTSLPMVFDGQRCAVPEFGVNVFSTDPDTLVPVHEFTKHVRNWPLSATFDATAGYQCDANRKRKKIHVPNGMRIGKKFKLEPACLASDAHLPLYDAPDRYFDCASRTVLPCPARHFFDGVTCRARPEGPTFDYKNVPLFHFRPFLNTESWIRTWDYKPKSEKRICTAPESIHSEVYDLCAHPDCESLAFLSTIPDLGILLQNPSAAKCVFDESTRRLRKMPVTFPYRFWEQRPGQGEEEHCAPGQRLKTGNFIWDRTVFATCDPSRPFLFCPASDGLVRVRDTTYACAPPASHTFLFSETLPTVFEGNEIRSVTPTTDSSEVVLGKKGRPIPLTREDVLDVPENKTVYLSATMPVEVALRYRVTFPPHVAFEYDETGRVRDRVAKRDRGFLPKVNTFTKRALDFPRYDPQLCVAGLEKKCQT